MIPIGEYSGVVTLGWYSGMVLTGGPLPKTSCGMARWFESFGVNPYEGNPNGCILWGASHAVAPVGNLGVSYEVFPLGGRFPYVVPSMGGPLCVILMGGSL